MNSSLEIQDLPIRQATPVHKNNQRLLNYWLDIRDAEVLPRKSDLDPMAIPALLPNIMLLESYGIDAIYCRLCGTAIVDRIGRELTSLNLHTILPNHLRPLIEFLISEVLGGPCGLLVHNILPLASGELVHVELIHLPMANDAGDICFTLSSAYVLPEAIQPGAFGGKVKDMQTVERFRLLLD